MSLFDKYRGDSLPTLLPLAPKSSIKAKVSLREKMSRGAVEWSPDLQRILDLPRRPPHDEESMLAWADSLEKQGSFLAAEVRRGLPGLVEYFTKLLKTPEGTQTLREIQAWVLWEAPIAGGLIGPIATGAGKTLLGMLMPMVMPNCKRAVLFIPPDLRAQFASDWESYGKHWVLPNLAGGDKFVAGRPVLHVIAYSELSSAKATALLDQIRPDLVMGDEISALRNFTAARTKRFTRFFANFPESRFCGWDATITSSSVRDYGHLLAIALSGGSPVPLDQATLESWARALDPQDRDSFYSPGRLEMLCEPGESPRSGFQRRLVGTLGVVATEENELDIKLVFYKRKPPRIPVEIQEHFKNLRRAPSADGWKRPDGEVFVDMLQVIACARQLACGFYMRWRFPRQEPVEVIEKWFNFRQSWNRELREQLKDSRVHMDSPKLCENAAIRWYDGGCTGCARGPQEPHHEGCRDVETHPLWPAYSYQDWRAVEDTVEHVTETVWESDWLLQDVAEWARQHVGIIWVEHPEFGERLSRMTGLRYYGGGDAANEAIGKVDGSASIIASVNSHKKGKNLQRQFSKNLVVSFPSAGVEQLVGRTYRSEQPAAEVGVWYYNHTPELDNAIDKAKERAKYVYQTMGTAQKLVYGEWRDA